MRLVFRALSFAFEKIYWQPLCDKLEISSPICADFDIVTAFYGQSILNVLPFPLTLPHKLPAHVVTVGTVFEEDAVDSEWDGKLANLTGKCGVKGEG